MAYVGIGNRQDYVADFQSQNFSGDGSTTAFTLNYEAVTGSIRVAVDNVLQPADGSSYTVDGFTLNFDSAPASGTNNITVLFLGTVRNISSVSDGAIVASKLASNAVETAKILDGAVTAAKLSGVTQGITEADMWRLTSNLTLTNSTTDITSNLERVDTNGFGQIGTGMTESSGIFTFPSTGMYLIKANFTGEDATNTPFYILGNIATTTNNSSYTTNSRSHTAVATTGDTFGFSVDTMFNVTDTTTHKVKFQYENPNTTAIFYGNTSNNYTYFQFIRLGDSV